VPGHARGATARPRLDRLPPGAGRLASLLVQDPRDERTMGSDIVAAPGGSTGDWWYWFTWGERIAPVHAPGAAADAIISALREPQTLS
jgi:hypothetical protein